MSEIYAVDAVHFSMVQSLKNTIRKIKREKQRGVEDLLRSHYLPGLFPKLCKKEQFQDMVFPGFSREGLRSLPKDLVELVSWDELNLDVEPIAVSAATVLRNIKIKGSKQGQEMDEETEKVLTPQIAQEALAKSLLEEVQKLNRRISTLIALAMKKVALPSDERAQRDQLDEEVLEHIHAHKWAQQGDFLGAEWIPILQKDTLRYLRDEKLSAIDSRGLPVALATTASTSLLDDPLWWKSPNQRIVWIERDAALQETYPALSELLDQLHALAFELNSKRVFSDLDLLEPGSGSTLLTVHPVGSEQQMRWDVRKDVDGFDSSIRITCCYNFRLPHQSASTAEAGAESGAEASAVSTDGGAAIVFEEPASTPDASSTAGAVAGESTTPTMQVQVQDDLLTLHVSAALRNGRTCNLDIAPDVVWVSVHHFICGRQKISKE